MTKEPIEEREKLEDRLRLFRETARDSRLGISKRLIENTCKEIEDRLEKLKHPRGSKTASDGSNSIA